MKKSEISKLKKDELIKLIETHHPDVDKTAILTDLSRNQLLDMAKQLVVSEAVGTAIMEEKTVDERILAVNMTDEPNKETKEEINTEITPADGPAWTEYVLSLLDRSEIVDGHPSCDGLRRIFPQVLGSIFKSIVTAHQLPELSNNNRATISVQISYLTKDGMAVTISDIADCYDGNTQAPYCNFPTATASTIAEGRCLRKALNIRVSTKEEMNKNDGPMPVINSDPLKASDTQRNLINSICSRTGIVFNNLLISVKEEVKATLMDQLTSQEARILLQKLNEYQQKPDSIPLDLFEQVNNNANTQTKKE